ncbi:MAG: DUF6525 family protein [Tabrizicola sp.]
MNRNLSAPRTRRRKTDRMAAHDRLPPDLRVWASLLRLWQRALGATGCPQQAAARLTRAEARTLARDRAAVRGSAYPTGDPSDLSDACSVARPAEALRPSIPSRAVLPFSQILSGGLGGEAPPTPEEEAKARRRDKRLAPKGAP